MHTLTYSAQANEEAKAKIDEYREKRGNSLYLSGIDALTSFPASPAEPTLACGARRSPIFARWPPCARSQILTSPKPEFPIYPCSAIC